MAIHFLSILNLTGLRPVFTTLVHSLWLGAIMALLAGSIIFFTRRSGSLLRYKLLTGLLMLFTVSIVYIFYAALTNTKTLTGNKVIMVSNSAEVQQTQNVQQQEALFNNLLSFFETHADTIVSIWFVVICFKCIRLISGLRALHRLKKTSITEAGAYWVERMNELAARIGIVKQVELLQSSIAKIPMVIGHLKPIILFPIGILNALPADEVEAILLHELAHIRRNDFLINLLQQFAEIVFFFNPAVLWVSSLIKNERENCCDDIAIAVTHDKKIFIHALVSFQEYNEGLTYATTFPGSRNHLLNRVKRIITNNNKTLNNMEKLILASGIIVTSLLALAFSPDNANIKKEAVKTAQAIATAIVDNATTKEREFKSNANAPAGQYGYIKKALPQKETEDTTKMHYSGVIDGKKIRLTEVDGQVKELYVDGKKIPEDQYDKYATIINKIHQEMAENTAKLKMESDLLKQEKVEMVEQQIQELKEVEEMKEQSELMKQDFSKQKELMEQKQVEMQKEMKLMGKKNEEMSKAQMLKMQDDLIHQQKRLELKQKEFQKQAEKMRLQQEKFNEIMRDSVRAKRITRIKPTVYSRPGIPVKPEIVAESAVLVKPGLPVKSVTSIKAATGPHPVTASTISPVNAAPGVAPVFTVRPAVYVTSSSISDEIIHELEKANIISTRDNLSFRLTNKELIVNDVKQADAIHQNILKKYVKKPGDNISLSYSNRQ